MKSVTIGVPRSSAGDIQVTKDATEGTTIRRFDDDAATIQALLSGKIEAAGSCLFYVQRLKQQRPGVFETKLEFTRLDNGACTRLGDKPFNAAINSFLDQMIAKSELKVPYEEWMGMVPPSFPDVIEGIPFTVA